jgi:hypothetical protein
MLLFGGVILLRQSIRIFIKHRLRVNVRVSWRSHIDRGKALRLLNMIDLYVPGAISLMIFLIRHSSLNFRPDLQSRSDFTLDLRKV